MKLRRVELRRVRMPLVAPFRTSFGTETERDVLLVRVRADAGDGWGECVAGAEPLYSSEYVDGAQDVIGRHLLPRLFALPDARAHLVGPALAAVRGHPMVGSVAELLDAVAGYVAAGYRRVKLKIEPGWDLEPVRAVRERFGSDLALQVDANAAYTLADARRLAGLDAFDLLLLEQPLAEDAVRAHAALARMVRTPICLDESITSARAAADAIALGACAVVNVKAGRVGGYLEARRVHDVCAAHGVPVWCGGMLETGLGRAANVALAALPNFTLPGDTSASDRYYHADLTPPFVLEDGRLRVPAGPGLGVDPVPERLRELTTSVRELAGDA